MDSGYFQQEIERQVETSLSEGLSESNAWSRIPKERTKKIQMTDIIDDGVDVVTGVQ
jgi:hypothetical protein